jgi:osmotically inducible protein OsmC
MGDLLRKAGAIWTGDLRTGKGIVSTESRALYEEAYDFGTRFENEPGTNPEELIAAAHAACFSMALASTLKKKGYSPKKIITNTTCKLTPQNGGFAITGMHLSVRGEVPDIDEDTFEEITMEADKGCPVSNLLRSGLEIEIQSELTPQPA